MTNGRKWIAPAIKHPGAFSRYAKSMKLSPGAAASKVLSSKSATPHRRRQAALVRTLGKLPRHHGPRAR